MSAKQTVGLSKEELYKEMENNRPLMIYKQAKTRKKRAQHIDDLALVKSPQERVLTIK